MAALKYSRQREAIKEFLSTRKDHPTADIVYDNLRKIYPNISLGTVYRNLSLLVNIGEVKKITSGYGPDRFDARTAPHNHFICNKCHSVLDLDMKEDCNLDRQAAKNFDGCIEGHITYFYGICEKCTKIVKKDVDTDKTA